VEERRKMEKERKKKRPAPLKSCSASAIVTATVSHGTVFFSHNKSTNNTFQPGFSAKLTKDQVYCNYSQFSGFRDNNPVWPVINSYPGEVFFNAH
jgi:hypothetical protein